MERIKIQSVPCNALIDSGSIISSISEEFYQQYCGDIPIQSLDELFDGKLKITSATSNDLNILGFIEVNIHLPGVSHPIETALTILSGSILNEEMPALLGSNVLDVWQGNLMPHSGRSPFVVNGKTICLGAVPPEQITVPTTMIKNAPEAATSAIRSPTTLTVNQTNKILEKKPVNLTCTSVMTPNANQPNPIITHSEDSQIHMNNEDDNQRRQEFIKLFDCSNCPMEHKAHLEDILWKNRDSFATSHHELGRCNTVKHDIQLSDNTPIRQKYRRIPPHLFVAVQDELQKMYETDVIRPSMSPWASPVSIAVKPDGSPRICLDLRKVNELTKKDAKSVPNVQEMFDMLNGKKIFSSLDLFSGFFQIELEEKCKEVTAFTCGPLGFWEMNRMPFGACNSSATFQRTMETVLGELLHSTSLVYVDDIIVHATSPIEHITNLDKVFRRLRYHGLRLKPSKCTLFSSELKFLGHMITNNGLEKDPSKIQAIMDWERPTTVTEVRQFMGMCGFLRKFIRNFATIAAPITDLSRGYKNGRTNRKENKAMEETKFTWDAAQEEAFCTLKKLIAEDVTLAYADFNLPFRLSTDACRTGLGAVFEQEEENGNWRPIGFASRRTSETERNYPTHKLEFLALKWAITEKFSDYLRTHFFTVYTDNNPLTYVLTNPKLDATSQRWVSSLEPYPFIIKYKPGTDNTVADALSRKYEKEDADDTAKHQSWCRAKCADFDHQQVAAITIHDTLGTTADPKENYDWHNLQEADDAIAYTKDFILSKKDKSTIDHEQLTTDTNGLIKHVDHLTIENDLLYYRDTDGSNLRLVVPSRIQNKITNLYHSLRHIGAKKVLLLLKQRFFWNHMKLTTTCVVASCERCQVSKTTQHKNKGPLQHIETPSEPMYQLSLDYLQIDTRANTKLKILTVIDEFTKFGWALIVNSENARVTAEKLYRELYTKFGIPSIIHSDRGQTFLSKIIEQLNKLLSIKHTTTTAYRPQSNATSERFNQTLISRIRSLPPREKSRWHLHVDSLVFAYNSTTHESTNMSPYYAMFGRHPKLRIDLMVRIPENSAQRHIKIAPYAEQRGNEMRAAFRTCADNIKRRRARNKKNYDNRYVKNPILCYEPTDKVLLVNHTPKSKVDDRYNNEIHEII